MLNDALANTMSKILNAEKVGKDKVMLKPFSKTIKKVLDIMKEQGYVGEYKEIEDGKGNILELNLLGQVNKCGAIKPRFTVQKDGFEKFERRYLPAKDFGIIIVSTPQGMMTHQEAVEKKIGGSILAYCY